MAKLFATIDSDRADKHQIANRFLEIKVFYGSRDDSKLLIHILVEDSGAGQLPKFFQHNTVEPKPMELKEPLKVMVRP